MAAKRPPSLSKSRVMLGIQCEKSLHYAIHRPDFAPIASPERQALLDQGVEVGERARRQFPSGILIDVPHYSPEESLRATAAAIYGNALSVFEAAFAYQGVLVRVDILTRPSPRHAWQLIEVKSSTSLKTDHLQDLAVQAWVIRGVGHKIKSISLMHLNPECRYPDLSDLFRREDVTREVIQSLPTLNAVVARLHQVVEADDPPQISIGPHCQKPRACPYVQHCWRDVPPLSVFQVPKLSSDDKWQLYRRGIVKLSDVSTEESRLNELQRRMIDVSLGAGRYVDRPAIANRIAEWQAPLSFLDFETIAPAVPRFAGTGPYEQVPFQYSCHILSNPGAHPAGEAPALIHREYLHRDASDPRPSLVEALLCDVPTNGSVVAYYAEFEGRVLRKLAEDFPARATELRSIADRLVDPLPIIRDHVYDVGFEGSFSIKKVAPSLLGDSLSYEGLEVGDGGAAQRAYAEMIAPQTAPGRRAALVLHLLKYCGQDTLAMVRIFEWLCDPQ